ncbi:MAG: type I methionyl aminopeptidase [Candidatus Cloacimonetes bacterium]|nr:type I methionyl aminopeptidase [Candidatus Cloacimonadota bacterium]
MITIKNAREIQFMRKSNALVALILDEIHDMIKPGVIAFDLNAKAEEIIRDHKAESAFKGYVMDDLDPYKYAICASVNDEIVHGYSTKDKILKDGDIIGIDVGVKMNGFCGDAARTFVVGSITKNVRFLLDCTKKALNNAIMQCRPGNRIGDISASIEETALENGLHVADWLTGHGIGRTLHEDPMIPNVGKKGTGPILKPGMTLSIEPMFNIGTSKTVEKEWVFYTMDGSPSAHFENTILITENEPEILTKTRSS